MAATGNIKLSDYNAMKDVVTTAANKVGTTLSWNYTPSSNGLVQAIHVNELLSNMEIAYNAIVTTGCTSHYSNNSNNGSVNSNDWQYSGNSVYSRAYGSTTPAGYGLAQCPSY